MPVLKYYSCEEEFEEKIHHKLKFITCPNCGLISFLILHGFLKGYGGEGLNTKGVKRGHRIFCSNRKKRKGCGKTFSVLLAKLLKGFTFPAKVIWRFFSGLLEKRPSKGHNRYRLNNIFSINQTHIREKLLSITCAPETKNNNPVIQTLQHLKLCFQGSACPITEFQLRFQKPFFKYKLPEYGLLK